MTAVAHSRARTSPNQTLRCAERQTSGEGSVVLWQCAETATVEQIAGCVHEHMLTGYRCAAHAEHVQSSPHDCPICLALDHHCTVRVLTETAVES